MWKMNCAQLAGFDEALSSKEAEIEALKERVSQLEAMVDPGAILPTYSFILTCYHSWWWSSSLDS